MKSEQMLVIAYYKYFRIKNPELVREELFSLSKQLSLKGRTLIGKEGINGSVSGTNKNIEVYKKKLAKLFPEIEFKEGLILKHAFSKLSIRTRKEIVSFENNTDPNQASPSITPEELNHEIENNNNIILLDARNNYETKIGRFENAIDLNIDEFREFPKKIDKISHLKNKKVIMYCTGGIRCEKASAYLLKNGFKSVFQLHGGILNYNKKSPNSHFKGRCFVFDNRISIPINKGKFSKTISNCELCEKSCDNYLNCSNIACDKLFICCPDCQKKMNSTCSHSCSTSSERRTK